MTPRPPPGQRQATAPVLVDMADGVALVTLNRPHVLNAMNIELMECLRNELAALSEDRAVRCVLVRGAGRAFCAGGDLAEIKERRAAASLTPSPGTVLDEQSRLMSRHEDSVRLLHTMPKPTVAVVGGHAVGGGLALALAADVRLVSRTAKLRIGFRQRSLSGDFGIAYFLTHIVGAAKARELMLFDPLIDGEQALAIGLATAVYEHDRLAEEAFAVAADLARGPTIAFGRMKDNILAAETLSLDDALRIEGMNQRVSANTLDAAEAGDAFAERREPRFTGE